ncbi:hypothetical protein CLUG_00895 [Clavispora lusitaniae ATCC 42720]|uniref:Ubiquitin-like protease family profile domain-containing protein n=1 Tax=Clavispora lusitaniae (strain ATCC 42720) TaxID=306902 RepID=C4XY72_CLAL4|nr:uncharacterized protein CLUG_00895 [Clavispora lusitaniae ATCC 42720]EEQ36772.1 hypothetical protein CLUG_00895 [Clavispora lusitaniae ATCC 42720]
MSLRKDFSSLRKQRYSGTSPRNSLIGPVHKIVIPTDDVNAGALYVMHPSNPSEMVRSQDVRTCFFLPIAILDSGLGEVSKISLGVSKVDYNLNLIEASTEGKIRLRVSTTEEYIYFVKGKAFLDKMAIPKDAIRKIACNEDCSKLLIVLEKRFGFFFVEFTKPYAKFIEFLASWLDDKLKVLPEEDVISLHDLCIKRRQDLQKDPQLYEVVTSDPTSENVKEDSDNILRNGLPAELNDPNIATQKVYMGRKTRAVTKLLQEDPEMSFQADNTGEFDEDDNSADEDEPVIQETPAPFDPPLKHTLANGKKFIVAFNDFKTLYNNDWINDTLIDFFIAYEIDKAVNEFKSVDESNVYAFNSFFFTKLMSKAEDQEVPDYYENIKRWLSKVDLMSYEAIIMPINEHLHWYCCIIKNLPKLLRYAKRAQKRKARGLENEKDSPHNSEIVAEIFVFDSLRQTHPNIVSPLKTLIAEYCRDKHGVEIDTDSIRMVTARVPRQRNFNDCGIHVIYNVRKWLREPSVCERMWKKFAKNQKNYFSGSERSGLRKTFIDILLDLHSKQPSSSEDASAASPDEHESDDEIELISYHSSKPEEAPPKDANETNSQEAESNDKPQDSPSSTPNGANKETLMRKSSSEQLGIESSAKKKVKCIEAVEKSPVANTIRTLDPRVVGTEIPQTDSFESNEGGIVYQIEHPQIRRLCMKMRLKPHTIKFLNEFFEDHSKAYNEDKQKTISEFVSNYNYFNPQIEVKQCELLIKRFKETLQGPMAPVDEPFVIEEVEESGEELNRSVSDLRISSDEPKRRKGNTERSTPEATKRFMRETDVKQCSPRLKERSPKTDASPSLSDAAVDILEDEVQIVSEKAYTSPGRQMRSRLSRRPKNLIQSNLEKLQGKSQTFMSIKGTASPPRKNTVVTVPDDESKLQDKDGNGRTNSTRDKVNTRSELLGPKRRRVQSSNEPL